MKTKNLIKITITILIMGVLLYKIGFIKILETISQTKKIYFLHLVVLTFTNIYISGININLFLKTIKKEIKWQTMTRYSLIAWIFSLITPGKLGELGLIFLMKNQKVEMGEGTAIVFLDKIISMVIIIFFSTIGFFYFKFQNPLLSAVLISSILIIIIILATTEFTRRGIRKYILRKYSKNFSGFHKTLNKIKEQNKLGILINSILTFLRIGLTSLSIYFLFLSLNTNISFLNIFLINAMITIISYIPLTIQGIGIKEFSAVLLFSKIGIPSNITIAVYILFIIYKYLIGALSGVIIAKEIKTILKNERNI